jgi:hypothetical protein
MRAVKFESHLIQGRAKEGFSDPDLPSYPASKNCLQTQFTKGPLKANDGHNGITESQAFCSNNEVKDYVLYLQEQLHLIRLDPSLHP